METWKRKWKCSHGQEEWLRFCPSYSICWSELGFLVLCLFIKENRESIRIYFMLRPPVPGQWKLFKEISQLQAARYFLGSTSSVDVEQNQQFKYLLMFYLLMFYLTKYLAYSRYLVHFEYFLDCCQKFHPLLSSVPSATHWVI